MEDKESRIMDLAVDKDKRIAFINRLKELRVEIDSYIQKLEALDEVGEDESNK